MRFCRISRAGVTHIADTHVPLDFGVAQQAGDPLKAQGRRASRSKACQVHDFCHFDTSRFSADVYVSTPSLSTLSMAGVL
jgi:hypothetical protein